MSAPRKESSMGGFHFTLDDNLRVKSSTSHSGTPVATNSGLRNLANTKHLATYQQPVQGPVEFSTFQDMAKIVHNNRPGMPSNLNTVGIFHQSSLPRATPTGTGMSMDVTKGTVLTTDKRRSSVSHSSGASSMTFGTHSQKHHFTGTKF